MLGIKYFEKHLILKHRSGIHRYIQTKMDFLDISSMRVPYRYTVKIELKFEKWSKREFGHENTPQ